VSRSHPAPERQQAERRGHLAEARAAMMLRLKGYRILDRRWKSPAGEIDLVIRRGNAIAFVEVKTRSSVEEALESVSLRQRRRIVSAAHHWLASNPDAINCDCRFDIVLVTPYQWPQHLPNAVASDDQ
jgi:putative endonuclease